MATGSTSLDSNGLVSAVNKLEERFRSTETELTSLERKLQVEYSSMFDEQNSVTDDLRNPVQVVHRINEVKADFQKIKQDVAEVQKQQAEMLEVAKVEFGKLLTALSSLENRVLNPGDSGSEAVDHEQKLLSLVDHMAKKTASSASSSQSTTASDQPPSPSAS